MVQRAHLGAAALEGISSALIVRCRSFTALTLDQGGRQTSAYARYSGKTLMRMRRYWIRSTVGRAGPRAFGRSCGPRRV